MITANFVRALKEEREREAVFLLPENCFNYMGPDAEMIDSIITERILFYAEKGRTRIAVGIPCVSNHTDAWNYDTARIVCGWCEDNDYDAWVEPCTEQYEGKKYFLVTIDWER